MPITPGLMKIKGERMSRIPKSGQIITDLKQEITEKKADYMEIPLYKRANDGKHVEGFERSTRPHNLIRKVFWKLLHLYQRIDEQYHELFDKQMFGAEQGDYDPKLWQEISKLEEQRLRMSGAIAALRWSLDLTDSMALDMHWSMKVDLNALEPELGTEVLPE